MKEKIKYEYHIDVDSLIEKEDYCMFQKEQQYFYFSKVKRTESEMQDLLRMYEELVKKGYPVHKIVMTVSGSLFVMVDATPYLLICVDEPMREYSFLDMIQIWDKMPLNSRNSSLIRENWGNLWSEKIDYFEYQIHELGKEKGVVLNTFGYFAGLAENAISYVNRMERMVTIEQKKICLCHRRVWYPNYHLNYDNPLQFVLDLEVRDVGEYLKGEALENLEYALIDLKSYLELRHLDFYSLGMLYGRLLYPSYYFDLYENVMNFDVSDECLLQIMDKVPVIEEFLKRSYEIISHFGPIEPVEWILKKEAIN